jgi:uncharacterized protein with HEPN domain
MANETRHRLLDALDAIGAIGRSPAGMGLAAFVGNADVRDAVAYRIIVLGEALSWIGRKDPATAERIPDLRRIVATRNRIIHTYREVDDRIVWDSVDKELPRLALAIRAMLNEDDRA